MRLAGMETFTLVVWLMMGQRFEETRIESLNRAECKRLMALLGDRGQVKAKCIMEQERLTRARLLLERNKLLGLQ